MLRQYVSERLDRFHHQAGRWPANRAGQRVNTRVVGRQPGKDCGATLRCLSAASPVVHLHSDGRPSRMLTRSRGVRRGVRRASGQVGHPGRGLAESTPQISQPLSWVLPGSYPALTLFQIPQQYSSRSAQLGPSIGSRRVVTCGRPCGYQSWRDALRGANPDKARAQGKRWPGGCGPTGDVDKRSRSRAAVPKIGGVVVFWGRIRRFLRGRREERYMACAGVQVLVEFPRLPSLSGTSRHPPDRRHVRTQCRHGVA
jgi:hypothetical protein